MRSLLIEYDDDFVIIAPTPRIHQFSFETLLNHLQEKWQQQEQADGIPLVEDIVRQAAERLSVMLPRLDKPGTFGFDVRSLPQSEFESLFLAQVINGKIYPCKLIELHSFKTEAKKPKKEGEELTPADIPIPSSGIPDADLFASLIGIDETIEGAWRLWTQFDSEFINGAIAHLSELRRDPKERMNEYLKRSFDEWKQQNKGSYYNALGIS